MEEKIKTKLYCKNCKPRRVFKCPKDSIYSGAKVRMSPEENWWRAINMKLIEFENPAFTVKELAGIHRLMYPNASIHIRRGHRVAVHPHNEHDCLKLLKYAVMIQRKKGIEMTAEILLSSGKIISIDDFEIFEDPKKMQEQ